MLYYGIKFYHYYFKGKRQPVIIEATNRHEAKQTLERIISTLPNYEMKDLLGECVTSPIQGVSSKKIKGVKYLWVGKKTQSGWMTETEYKEAIKIYNQTKK